MTEAAVAAHAARLRDQLADLLVSDGAIESKEVEAAFRAVPRHVFVPGEPLKAVYAANSAVVVKRDAHGATLSCMSAAHMQAVMLEQAEIAPGMRVLEIGSGGCNAALLQELAGDGGQVTSVDIDPEVVERTGACLSAAGYGRVRVVLGDAEQGVPDATPYDRIVVTAGAWDVAPAWLHQLAEGGRIVVPLRLRGLTRSIAFDRDGAGLVSRSYRLAGFVPMQGAGSHGERVVPLAEEIALRLDDQPVQVDAAVLGAAVRGPKAEAWSGAAFDLPDELELFLMTSMADTVLLHASERLVAEGVFAASAGRGVPALIRNRSIAYRTKRPCEQGGGFESGVFAHGRAADQVAGQYVEALRLWAGRYRRRGAAGIRYTPGSSVPAEPSCGVIVKRHGAVTVSWP